MNCDADRPSAWTTDAPGLAVGWTTLPSRDEAFRLARTLAGEGLVACAQADGPIRSFYRWEGALHEDEEWRLTLKFAAGKADAVEARMRALHPYATPQWIVVRADRVGADYLAWASGPDTVSG